MVNDNLMESPDGEALCAALCRASICSASFTTDTDLLPYGGNVWITEIKKFKNKNKINIIYRDDVLKKLNLSPEKFRDMCILLGTDFNKRFRGNGVKTVFNKRIKDPNLNMYRYVPNYDEVLRTFRSSNEDFDLNKLEFLRNKVQNFIVSDVLDNIDNYDFKK